MRGELAVGLSGKGVTQVPDTVPLGLLIVAGRNLYLRRVLVAYSYVAAFLYVAK